MPTFNATSTGRAGSTQDWTVPSNGSWRITARGARGGYAFLSSTSTQNPGGTGAVVAADFTLTAGHVIRMMVGQTGGDNPRNDRAGAGGGGTFVFNQTTSTLLLVAGGGGGAGQYASGTLKNAVTGTTSNPGTAGGSSTSPHGGAAGTAGPAGGAVVGSYGGAGGGYTGNGASTAYGAGGNSYTNDGTGGTGYNDGDTPTIANYNGGYGGGGGSYAGGGGGGGYGGGGNGGWSMSGDGGGGSSYITGSNQSTSVTNNAAGSVDITSNNALPNAPLDLVVPTAVYPPDLLAVSWRHSDPNGDTQQQHQLRIRVADV